jgi:hypothetical protein
MKASNVAETAERKSLPGSMKEGMTDKARVICRDRLQWILPASVISARRE